MGLDRTEERIVVGVSGRIRGHASTLRSGGRLPRPASAAPAAASFGPAAHTTSNDQAPRLDSSWAYNA